MGARGSGERPPGGGAALAVVEGILERMPRRQTKVTCVCGEW
ncbi:MAG: hypothetical protein QOI83_4440 [Streptomycetaceae bacterium]|nr:hypothetical protein [Streptomycetaceae bacterium]